MVGASGDADVRKRQHSTGRTWVFSPRVRASADWREGSVGSQGLALSEPLEVPGNPPGAEAALARLLGDELERSVRPGIRQLLVDACRQQGYTYVCLDLDGYRTGSMNEVL